MDFLRRLLKEAQAYWPYLLITAIAVVALTGLDLIAPQLVRRMLYYVETEGMLNMERLRPIALGLLALYGLKIVFRFLAQGVLNDLQVGPHKNVPISIRREEGEREEKNNPSAVFLKQGFWHPGVRMFLG